MATLIIRIEVDTDPTREDPVEVAEELFDEEQRSGGQNASYTTGELTAEWAE